ncbi:adenosylcobinamide-phosphate synthase CbiB [Clostridium sp. D33t1_170424_F3]|uniref:adenosylcobinamide-phosphate synthase CbiB n=1 Tax=Clostridium sp. D33t1_170424_F3 TaxID=2787099 RepID=UPI0018AA14B6|nr:adenosylcobinamide-phosphate synthase CbiB [Clostridium sp. D33t1_170424_F3]
MIGSLAALLLGFLLDLCLGDPHWLPHPVRLIGWLIQKLEKLLRACFPKTERGERFAGVLLAVLVPLFSTCTVAALLFLCRKINVWLSFALETLLCYQMLAAKSLRTESMKVYDRLREDDLEGARKAVSMIVGRDTQALSETGVTKAAVETVAENTSDGEIAPLFFLALGGAPLGVFYKAVNTMDSMVGYKNERYLHFGRAAAKLDDILNFIPSRLSAWLMILVARPLGLDAENALRIYRRDRFCHASPNSAQTEAACAGALGVQLAGDASYFGKLVAKPTIGDEMRPVVPEDIRRANRLLYGASILMLLLCVIFRFCIVLYWG